MPTYPKSVSFLIICAFIAASSAACFSFRVRYFLKSFEPLLRIWCKSFIFNMMTLTPSVDRATTSFGPSDSDISAERSMSGCNARGPVQSPACQTVGFKLPTPSSWFRYTILSSSKSAVELWRLKSSISIGPRPKSSIESISTQVPSQTTQRTSDLRSEGITISLGQNISTIAISNTSIVFEYDRLERNGTFDNKLRMNHASETHVGRRNTRGGGFPGSKRRLLAAPDLISLAQMLLADPKSP
mmetsp:Transcript_1855/g.2886  ORF Transcript_1855/g.2886 Transcript_1855/m.2886 type:complete len:243 (-) Transcript_1855:1848-2576(-)